MFSYDLWEQKIDEFDPRILELLYPRIYDPCGNYGSVKHAALDLAGMIMSTRFTSPVFIPNEVQDNVVINGVVTAEALIRHDVPTFFISKDFYHAAINSTPPMDFPVSDLRFPHPAMIFMLPKDVLVTPKNGPLEYLSFAYFKDCPRTYKSAFSDVQSSTTVVMEDMITWFSTPHQSKLGVAFGAKAGGLTKGTLGDFFARCDATEGTPGFEDGGKFYAQTLDEQEEAFVNGVFRIIFQLVLAMTARPELIERGKERKPMKREGNTFRRAFWSPNIVGRKLVIERQPGATGTGSSPRMHWRRGHYRSQPFGEGRTQRHTIWIQPMLIAGTERELV